MLIYSVELNEMKEREKAGTGLPAPTSRSVSLQLPVSESTKEELHPKDTQHIHSAYHI